MKKEIIVFVSNVLIVFFGVGIILNTVPLYKGTAAAAAGDILSASMPYTNLKASAQQGLSYVSDNAGKKAGPRNTSPEEASAVRNTVGSKDGVSDEE